MLLNISIKNPYYSHSKFINYSSNCLWCFALAGFGSVVQHQIHPNTLRLQYQYQLYYVWNNWSDIDLCECCVVFRTELQNKNNKHCNPNQANKKIQLYIFIVECNSITMHIYYSREMVLGWLTTLRKWLHNAMEIFFRWYWCYNAKKYLFWGNNNKDARFKGRDQAGLIRTNFTIILN